MWDSLKLLHAEELTACNIQTGETLGRIVKIPIVGSQHMDVETYSLTKGVTLVREPDNPYDKNAIKVCHDGRDIGYIPRDKQHYLNRDFVQNDDWSQLPKAIATSSSWSIYVAEPR